MADLKPDQLIGFLGTNELAEMTHAPVATVYRWIAEGTAPVHYRVGKRVLFRVDDVKTWLEERRVEAPWRG